LPVNNGTESIGESIVIDFESTYFIGTLLLRIKQAMPASIKNRPHQSSTGSYFDGKKRKFQAVIQGRFKKPLPMSQCVTGQASTRRKVTRTVDRHGIHQVHLDVSTTVRGDHRWEQTTILIAVSFNGAYGASRKRR
jgi:hypothetical protein